MQRIYTIIICLLSGTWIYGQSGYQANQYMFNQQLINPAYSGKDYKVKGALLANQQMTGISSSPRLLALSFSSPIGLSRSSIGFNATHFSYGVQSNSECYAVYSYRIPFKKWSLVYGLQAGIVNVATTNSKLKTGEAGDERFMTNQSGMGYNFGGGLYLFNHNTFLSVSAPAWFQHRLTPSGNLTVEYQESNMPLFISAGKEVRISKNWWFDPYFLIRTYMNGRTMADLNLIFDYKNAVWVGPSYKTGSQIGLILGVRLNKHLKLNYSGAISQQARQGFMGSAHEVSLVFMLKDKLHRDAMSPRFF